MTPSTELFTENSGPMSNFSPSLQCAGSFDALTDEYSLSFSVQNDRVFLSLDYLKIEDLKEIASCLVAMMDCSLEANEDNEEVE